jgi:hypothetical protein
MRTKKGAEKASKITDLRQESAVLFHEGLFAGLDLLEVQVALLQQLLVVAALRRRQQTLLLGFGQLRLAILGTVGGSGGAGDPFLLLGSKSGAPGCPGRRGSVEQSESESEKRGQKRRTGRTRRRKRCLGLWRREETGKKTSK